MRPCGVVNQSCKPIRFIGSYAKGQKENVQCSRPVNRSVYTTTIIRRTLAWWAVHNEGARAEEKEAFVWDEKAGGVAPPKTERNAVNAAATQYAVSPH